MQRGCELCEGVAALYCSADKAHICWTCDAKVHSANFLVARHTRSVLCTTCATPTPWRTSGANPTPLLTGPQLCANCSSQGESQGECTTRENNNNEDPIVNSNNRIATAVSISSGCSTSNNPGSSSGFVAVRESPCTQIPTPQLTSSDSSSTTTVSTTVSTTTTTTTTIVTVDSVSSRISACHPKRLAPGGVVQIATRALQDVNRSVSRGQCDCREEEESHEPIYGERRGCSRSESAKESMRPGAMAMAVQQVPVASTSRVMRTLAKWHWDLHLSSPGTVPLALRMFRKVSRALAPAVLSNAGLRVTLAACLRLAAGLDEAQVVVPKASEVAACAGVSMRRLAMTEIHLLALLGWRRFPIWAGVRS